DVVNDVWASFFAEPPAGRRFDHPSALAAYLGKMASNKVAGVARRRGTLKNDAGREQPLSDRGAADPPAATPTPSQIVGAEDEWQAMLSGRPLAHQRILTLLRQGMSHAEIAVRLGTNERTIRRLVRRIEQGRGPALESPRPGF